MSDTSGCAAAKNYPTEWTRTGPDLVVYRPSCENGFDSVNQHFLVVRSPETAWLYARS